MKNYKFIRAIAILLTPGGIPAALAYLLYRKLMERKK